MGRSKVSERERREQRRASCSCVSFLSLSPLFSLPLSCNDKDNNSFSLSLLLSTDATKRQPPPPSLPLFLLLRGLLLASLLLLLGAHNTTSTSNPSAAATSDPDAARPLPPLLPLLLRHHHLQHPVLHVRPQLLHLGRGRKAHRAGLEGRGALGAVVASRRVFLLFFVLFRHLDRDDVSVDEQVDAGVLDARDVGKDLEVVLGFLGFGWLRWRGGRGGSGKSELELLFRVVVVSSSLFFFFF